MKTILTTILFGLCGLCLHAAQQQPGTIQVDQPELRLWYDTAATYFEESLPIGNGKMGALVYGGAIDNVIYLNDITLWTGKPIDRTMDQDAHQWIPEIRKALFAEDYRKADQLQLKVQGNNSQYYQPLATLHLTNANKAATSRYYRELDIDSALCHDRFTQEGVTYEREYFASHPDQVIAIRITADRKGAINYDLLLDAQVPHRCRTVVSQGRGATRSAITLMGHATGDEQETTHFCSILQLSTPDGTATTSHDTLHIRNASELTLYFINETSFHGADKHPVKEGAPYIDAITNQQWHLHNYSYEQLRQRHISDYQGIFKRFQLQLGETKNDPSRTTEQQLKDYTEQKTANPYIETLYTQYGRYLLISCSRTPGVPANLQGLWGTKVYMPWRGNYTMNINLEENYWPAFVANMQEMALPLDQFIASLAANGQHMARNYYQITRGWCASHNSDIWAMANPVGEKKESPKWSNWNMGGAWLVHTLWERYAFTQDKNYLRDTAFPLMRGAAEFCLDWLVENPNKPDELITAPSTSPENEYITDQGYRGTTCYGGTADLAIIRELFTNTLEAIRILNKMEGKKAPDSQQRQQLAREISAKLSRLHPYTIGQEGDLNEWYHDWKDSDPQHRHQSHLIGLYPGQHLTDAELLKACENTLIQKGKRTTGWSTGWRINLWARLKKAEEAYQTFQTLLAYVAPDGAREKGRGGGGTYPNLFDAHPPFQIDGNFGGTAGVCEMLLQSRLQGDQPEIELLPALPQAWKEGSVRGICARGGITVDMRWSKGQLTQAVFTAQENTTVTVKYNGESKKLKLKKGVGRSL